MHPKSVKIFFALFFIVFFIFISTSVAQAAIVPCGTSANPQECGICDIFQLGQNGINYLMFTFAPIVFTGVALYAGYLLLTSRGKSTALSSATKILWDTALGVIIIFMAWLITTTILQSLAGDKNYAKEWYKIECTDPTISRSKLPGNGPGGSPFSCSADPTTLGADKKSKFTVSGNSTTGDLNCTWPDPLDGSYEGGKPDGPCEATVVFGSQTISASLNVSVSDSASPPKTGNVLCKVGQTGSSGTCNSPQSEATTHNEPFPRKNSSELDSLVSCIKSKLPGENLGSIFTYDQGHEICNYTRGQRTCSSCSHAINSCHYGGRNGSQGAQAVDFGNEAIGDKIINAANQCGAKSAGARCETAGGQRVPCNSSGANHVHVNSGTCDAN